MQKLSIIAFALLFTSLSIAQQTIQIDVVGDLVYDRGLTSPAKRQEAVRNNVIACTNLLRYAFEYFPAVNGVDCPQRETRVDETGQTVTQILQDQSAEAVSRGWVFRSQAAIELNSNTVAQQWGSYNAVAGVFSKSRAEALNSYSEACLSYARAVTQRFGGNILFVSCGNKSDVGGKDGYKYVSTPQVFSQVALGDIGGAEPQPSPQPSPTPQPTPHPTPAPVPPAPVCEDLNAILNETRQCQETNRGIESQMSRLQGENVVLTRTTQYVAYEQAQYQVCYNANLEKQNRLNRVSDEVREMDRRIDELTISTREMQERIRFFKNPPRGYKCLVSEKKRGQQYFEFTEVSKSLAIAKGMAACGAYCGKHGFKISCNVVH